MCLKQGSDVQSPHISPVQQTGLGFCCRCTVCSHYWTGPGAGPGLTNTLKRTYTHTHDLAGTIKCDWKHWKNLTKVKETAGKLLQIDNCWITFTLQLDSWKACIMRAHTHNDTQTHRHNGTHFASLVTGWLTEGQAVATWLPLSLCSHKHTTPYVPLLINCVPAAVYSSCNLLLLCVLAVTSTNSASFCELLSKMYQIVNVR